MNCASIWDEMPCRPPQASVRGVEDEYLTEPRAGMREHTCTGVIVLGSILPYKDPHLSLIKCSMLADTGCECMVVIGPELGSFFLREAATVPFKPMGVGQTHLEGGKQVVRGDVIVPLSRYGVVMKRCRDATIYVANVGPRCILEFPFVARYGIHIHVEPPCFLFEEDVGKVVTPNGLAGQTNAPSSQIRVQPHKHKSSARGASTATDVNDAERPAILTSGLGAIRDFDRIFVATSATIKPNNLQMIPLPLSQVGRTRRTLTHTVYG